MSMCAGTQHALMHWNEEIQIVREQVTTEYKKSCKFGKPRVYYYMNTRKSKMYKTLDELLEANPLVRQLAESYYPEK